MYYHKIENINEAWISERQRRVGLGQAKIMLVSLRDLWINDPDTALSQGCCTYQSKAKLRQTGLCFSPLLKKGKLRSFLYRHDKIVAATASNWSLQYHWLAGMKTESGLSLYMTAGVDNTNGALTYLYNAVLFATFSGIHFYINITLWSACSVFP